MKNFLLNTKNSYKIKIADKNDSNEITKLEELIFSDDSNSVSFINEIEYKNKYHILLVRELVEKNKDDLWARISSNELSELEQNILNQRTT